MKRAEISILNNLLGAAKLGGMSKEGKGAVIRTKVQLSKEDKAIDEVKKEAVNSIRTKEFEKLAVAEQQSSLSDEDKEQLALLTNRLNKELSEVLMPYLNEEAEVQVHKFSQEDFDAFCEVNDFNVAQLEFLMENMVDGEPASC